MFKESVVCAFCGCLCDDITVEIEDNKIISVKNACTLGKAWFRNHGILPKLPQVRVNGKETDFHKGIKEAANILCEAKSPFIYGLTSTSCEAQQKAIELAEILGGTIDCCTSVCHGPSVLAMQSVGEPTCTLGEVKNRADLVIFWGSNPVESHPRHMTRYSVYPKGLLTKRGRKDRTVIVVDVRETPSFRAADVGLIIPPGLDFEVLWVLLALIQNRKINIDSINNLGIPLENLVDLAERMKTCRYGVLFFGQGLTQSSGKQMNVAAASLITRELNKFTKFSIFPMRGHGNVAGMDNVLTWLTGFPYGVNFSRGYPRFNPGEFSIVDVMARREADALLCIAADPVASLPGQAERWLSQIPIIAIDTHESETTRKAKIAFIAATAGIGAPGTAYRMDNIPLFLNKIITSPFHSDEEILFELLMKVKEIKGC